MSPEPATCPRCAAQMLEGAIFCQRCGATAGDVDRRSRERDPDNPLPTELLFALRRDLSGEYQVDELLGQGGMSFVFLAQELELNRQVAIKVLPLQLLHGPGTAERFEREGKIAASLDHPHIVPIFRVGATSTFLWYTMKRIRGRSLEQIISERGRLPLPELLGVVQQVGSALQYAHRHGVVHRDVKPGNVMIEESGWALICDFGVARAFGSVSLTQTGASLGTPRYMAPEQFEGHPVDGRSDQYSLAILVWQALAGTCPFNGDTVAELIRQHLLEPPPRLATVRPDLPVHVSDAVHRALSKKPAERFPDIAAFVGALGAEATPRLPTPFSVPAEAPPRVIWWEDTTERILRLRRRPMIAVAVVATVALAGAGAWAAFKPTRPANGAIPQQMITPLAAPPSAPPAAPPAAAQPDGPRRVIAPAPAPAPVPAPAPARLSLSTQPTGMLFLDGTPIRSTPILGLALAPGRHRVQVKRDGFASFDTVFVATAGQEIKWTRRTLAPLGP